MNHKLRPIIDDEVFAFRQALQIGFGGDADESGNTRFRTLMPLERTVACFDDDEIVGTLGDFPLQLTVPGGMQLSMAGTSMVTVRATHTRRGILTAMMHRHLSNAVDRGDPIAGLWASESAIYERFGFGLAVERHVINVDGRRVTLPPVAPDLMLRHVRAEQVPQVVAPFWKQMAAERSGFVDRTDDRWKDVAGDPVHMRGGATGLRHVVVERERTIVGYLAYRQRDAWDGVNTNGSVAINTLCAADVDAHHALWAYALDVDLFPTVRYPNGATDDPIAYMVNDLRAFERSPVDALFVRLLDVPRALQARRYESDGQLTLHVVDDLGYGDGRYQLRVVDGQAVVAPHDGDAEIALSIRDLSALYLGRNCAAIYAAMGRITGEAPAIRTLGQLFATARAPWCSEDF